jgi:hypothetical protein
LSFTTNCPLPSLIHTRATLVFRRPVPYARPNESMTGSFTALTDAGGGGPPASLAASLVVVPLLPLLLLLVVLPLLLLLLLLLLLASAMELLYLLLLLLLLPTQVSALKARAGPAAADAPRTAVKRLPPLHAVAPTAPGNRVTAHTANRSMSKVTARDLLESWGSRITF